MITDTMLAAAAKRLGELAPAVNDPNGPLLPDFAGEHITYMSSRNT